MSEKFEVDAEILRQWQEEWEAAVVAMFDAADEADYAEFAADRAAHEAAIARYGREAY